MALLIILLKLIINNLLDQTLITWQAYSHIHYDKTYRWYVLAGAVVLTLVVIGLITDNPFMSLAFLLLTGVYFLSHQEEPKIVNYKLTTLGFYINEIFYPYAEISNFYIVYNPPHVSFINIILKSRKEKNILIQNIDPADIRELLLNRGVMELEKMHEPLFHVLARVLKL